MLVTARKRSLGKGNVFTCVCLSTGGGVSVEGGSCEKGILCERGLCERGWGGGVVSVLTWQVLKRAVRILLEYILVYQV